MPECPPTDKHLGPTFRSSLFLCASYCRVFTRDQTHSLQLWQHNLALEDAFAVDVDSPFAPWLSCVCCVFGNSIGDLKCWLRLVEVPVERGPQHHGNLASRRGSSFEFATVGVRYGRYVEMIAIEGRGPVAVNVARRKRSGGFILGFLFFLLLLAQFVF